MINKILGAVFIALSLSILIYIVSTRECEPTKTLGGTFKLWERDCGHSEMGGQK